MTTLFQRIYTVFVPTRDIKKAADWYVQVLGGTPGWSGDDGEYQCIEFGDTSITLFLTDEQTYFEPRRSAFNFYVSNAEEAHSYLKENGVRVEELKSTEPSILPFMTLMETAWKCVSIDC